MHALAQQRLAEVEQVASLYLTRCDELQPVILRELRRLIRSGEVTVVDVRPRAEYQAAHIPGAVSIPVTQLKRRLTELPKRKEVIAYCRGPYCIYSVEALEVLRNNGFRARRADKGLPDWRAEGFPVATSDDASP